MKQIQLSIDVSPENNCKGCRFYKETKKIFKSIKSECLLFMVSDDICRWKPLPRCTHQYES